MTKSIYDFSVKDNKGQGVSMGEFRGKAILVVNVASKCGYTPQYTGLEKLYKDFGSKGLVVLGFPCNQFGAQEPGSNTEIQTFCQLNYGVSFPIMNKVDVNGEKADPLFGFLKENAPGVLGTEAVKWNFTKFLIGKDGKVLDRYAPATEPAAMAKDIEKALA